MASALRIALRRFRQHPTFALVTVLVLGLGTGATTTVFTIVDAVVLRPLPYKSPDRLVTLWDTNHEKGLSHDPISPVNFMDYRELPVFEDAAAWWRPGVNLTDAGLDPVRVNTIEVSANLAERSRLDSGCQRPAADCSAPRIGPAGASRDEGRSGGGTARGVTRDKGQGTRDEGQGTRDKGQGRTERPISEAV